MITLQQIKEKTLPTVSRGYDIDETNAFISEIVHSYETVMAENKELYRKMEILAAKIEEYRDEEDSIKSVLLTAQKTADKLTKSAKEKAEEIIAESTESAQQAVLDAKEKAEKLVSEARDYAASFTKEKTEAANEIIGEAEKKANDAISGAKIVAKDILEQVKEVSGQLVSKAKEEKEYHESLISSLKDESNVFKLNLMALYETQLRKLRSAAEGVPEAEGKADTEEKLSAVQNEISSIFSEMKDIEDLVQIKLEKAQEEAQDAAEAEEEVQHEEAEEIEEANEIEEENPQEANDFELKEIGDEVLTTENAEKIEEVDVNSAIDAFSNTNETAQEEAPAEPVAEEETAEADGELPFESFFNVKNAPARTDEKISLIPPDDYVSEEEENHRGFFKKKKKK